MAVAAPTTGAPTRAPGNLDQSSAPSRRGLLGAVAAAGLAAAVTSPAIADVLDPTRRGWDRLKQEYETALRQEVSYYDNVYEGEHERFENFVGPHPRMIITYTAKDGSHCDFRVYPDRPCPQYGISTSPAIEAAYAREVAAFHAWHARLKAAENASRWRVVSTNMEKLWSAKDAAREALMAEPSPDGAALAYKVQLALENHVELWENETAALRTDAARLIATAR